ncbi:EipB family protein [Roseospira navarrensis]|uniref:DUF1849 family protein n=1 Tax=Roseospira navarrensis TaxID=140058 RepID=A0A7X2D3E1_9PROT|nr:DUF1849 family protein [Roseospira navarrensis]MQX36713.1 DUF1849 family protein [Roseospira navarrensis]
MSVAQSRRRSAASVARAIHTDQRIKAAVLGAALLVVSAVALAAAPAAWGQTVATGDGGAADGAAGSSFTLAPHEAVYDLRLISRAPGSPVATANGTMTYRIEDTCDGWAMESRTVLNLFYNRGDPVQTDWSFISWESKDATQYRFRIRSERNGTLDELIDGKARMAADSDSGGVAAFSKPADRTLDLAPRVLLPVQHTLRVLEAASAGDRIYTASMFDGSEVNGPMQSTAVIAEAVPAGAIGELPDNPLLDSPSWRMVLSFFAADSRSSLPDYEVRLRYHDNGVAEEVIQDFGTMALRGVLSELKPIEGGGC